MSKILIVAPLLAVLSASAAMGQDIPAERGFDWTGFYLGIQGGYQAGDGQITESIAGVPTGYAPPVDIEGLIGGAHIGYNYQTGVVVLGIEADAELADVTGTLQDPISSIFGTRQDWQASLRMRLGVAATDRLLIYATGGLAITGLEHAFNYLPFASYNDWNGTVAGVTIGLGADYALTDHEPAW